MKKILLGNNRGEVLVDDEDYKELLEYKWCIHNTSKHSVYAYRKKNGKSIMMHRVIMNPPSGLVVDHINGNGLDNRKENLRVCTHTQNKWNNFSHRKNIASNYRGVSLDRDGVWRATIMKDNKQINLGRFKKEEEAAAAYNDAAVLLRGEFARLNVIGG